MKSFRLSLIRRIMTPMAIFNMALLQSLRGKVKAARLWAPQIPKEQGGLWGMAQQAWRCSMKP